MAKASALDPKLKGPKDDFTTRGYADGSTGTAADDLLAVQRGIAWLNREIPSLQDFARAWTGRKINVRMGPFPCTDGDTIFLRPPSLAEGEDAPSSEYQALLFHEIAHCMITDLYDPPTVRDIEHALKYRADVDYGVPGGWIWNALEDGRVEEWLYKSAPGARKHIKRLIDSIYDETLHRIDNPKEPDTREQMDDLALLLGAYYESAGHKWAVEQFPQRVIDAYGDAEMARIIKQTHKVANSKAVLTELVAPFMKRARELGFFADHDPRGIGEDGQPKNVKWEDLTEEEREAIREQIRQAMRNPDEQPKPEKGSTGVEVPREETQKLYDELTDEEKDELVKQQRGEGEGPRDEKRGDQKSDEDSAGDGDEESDEDDDDADRGGDAGDQPADDGDEPAEPAGAGDERSSGPDSEPDGESGSALDSDAGDDASDDENHEATDEVGGSSDGGAVDQPNGEAEPEDSSELEMVASEPVTGTKSDADADEEFAGEDASIDELAHEEHDRREAERIERTKQFAELFNEVEEKMRPPHVEMLDKAEVPYEEKASPESLAVEEATKLEVGHVRGSERHDFVYRELKVRGTGNVTGKDLLGQFSDTISGNLNRMRAVFKLNRKSHFAGRFEMGQHVNQRALTGFMMKEHFKPFDRKITPKRTSYAVTLLIDQSGSMRWGAGGWEGGSGSTKIEMARMAVVMQGEMLHRLQIPFEVLGFTTEHGSGTFLQHSVFKSYDEPWSVPTINRVLAIEAQSENLDGLALAWAWERLQRRREQRKVLITYSDGKPSPDTDNQIRIMKHVLNRMRIAGALGIGVGIQTDAVDRLYPKVVHCNDLRKLPQQMVELLERELK